MLGVLNVLVFVVSYSNFAVCALAIGVVISNILYTRKISSQGS